MLRKRVSTRLHQRFEPLEDRLCLSALPTSVTLAQPDATTLARSSAAYGQLPLTFEANKGQTDSRVNFLSRGAGYSLFLTHNKAVLSLKHGDTTNVIGMRVVGANPTSHAVGRGKLASVSNYLIGNDPSRWRTNVPNYGQVSYQGIYRGVDLVYHGNQKQLEYDFMVKPGADPRAIRLAFDGIRSASLDRAGNLVLHTSGGDVVEHAPVVYQEINGRRQAVAGRYLLKGNHQVGFQVGRYDHSKPLVIDPTLSYSTYLGGKSIDTGYGIAVDSTGNAYVTGLTASNDFPTQNALQKTKKKGSDAFVTKINASGTALLYSTFLGGDGLDDGISIAVDSTSEAYISGETNATNFPTKNPFQAGNAGGTTDGFLVKLNAEGSALLYSTYLGGGGLDRVIAIAVDLSGGVYVTGESASTNFPTKNALQSARAGSSDAFVAKIDPSQVGAASLVYSTYLDGTTTSIGGTATSVGQGIAVDSTGSAYVTGQTNSVDFPTTVGAFQTTYGGGLAHGFVTKINPAGSALIYSTYLGGSEVDRGNGIAVDGSGNAYVSGVAGANFPTTAGAVQTNYAGGGDAFVTKLNADGSALIHSTYLGGSGFDGSFNNFWLRGLAVDSSGNAYVTGFTNSTDFPTTTGVFQPSYGGGTRDAFVAKLNADLSSLVYSTYLGGSNEDDPGGIAVDGSGNTYVVGQTYSTNFPTRNALDSSLSGTYDAFVTKISLS